MLDKTSDNYNNIYMLNDKPIMLDYDLAKIYKCIRGASELNFIVRKNIKLFSKDDYFLLSHSDYKKIIIQCSDLEKNYDCRRVILPYAFSEYAVYLLSLVIRTPESLKMQVAIINSFLDIKKKLSRHIILVDESNAEAEMALISESRGTCCHSLFRSFEQKNNIDQCACTLYKGKLYKYLEILNIILLKAKKYIIVVDNQLDPKDIKICKSSLRILLITSKNFTINNFDNIIIKRSNEFFEKYILVDGRTLYHLNDLACKEKIEYTSLNIILDKELIKAFKRKVYFNI